jgi:outer membrane lipase/esterase
MELKRSRPHLRGCIALAGALLAAAPVQAQNFDGSVYFGDSLTDAGTFGARFTTNPGPVWSELLAGRLGTQTLPAAGGGSNFAVGGARVTLLPGVPNTPPTDGALPITDQVSAYLASTGGTASRNSLYAVWGGANDIFVATALGAGATLYLTQTAGELAAQVSRLQAAGARYILVPNIPDIGATPFGVSQGPAGAAALSALSVSYNADLYAAIAARGLRVIPLDVYSLFNEVLASPGTYGIVNTAVPACGAVPSLLCTPADLLAPDAAQTFLFADGVHPTTAGHAIVADYAASIVAAPTQISMLPETAVQARTALVDRLYARLAHAAAQDDSGSASSFWVTMDGTRSSVEPGGLAAEAEGSGAGITVGADLARWRAMVLGASIGFSRAEPDFARGGGYRQEEAAISLYGGWQAGGWQARAALTYGALDYALRREIRLGSASRTASASPQGRNVSAGAEIGYRYAAGSLTHGPLASVLLQQAKLDGFAEEGAGSAGLRYGKQARSSAVARFGWQLALDAGDWRPFARLTLDRELRDSEREVEAELLTTRGMPAFSLPAATPERSSATVLAGAGVRLARNWEASFALSHAAARSGATSTGVFATVSARF